MLRTKEKKQLSIYTNDLNRSNSKRLLLAYGPFSKLPTDISIMVNPNIMTDRLPIYLQQKLWEQKNEWYTKAIKPLPRGFPTDGFLGFPRGFWIQGVPQTP